MNPALQGYTAAVVESVGPDAIAALARDLESIEELVLSNNSLHSVLTDTTMRGPVRRAVMLDLLDHKVSQGARRLAGFACAVVRATDVPTALNWLANRTRHIADGFDEEEAPLSLLASRQRVGGYATALHEDHELADLEELEDELFRFARALSSPPPICAVLS